MGDAPSDCETAILHLHVCVVPTLLYNTLRLHQFHCTTAPCIVDWSFPIEIEGERMSKLYHRNVMTTDSGVCHATIGLNVVRRKFGTRTTCHTLCTTYIHVLVNVHVSLPPVRPYGHTVNRETM